MRRFTTWTLPRNERFLYLDAQFAGDQFWESLIKTHVACKSAYGVAISSLLARDGAIPAERFQIISGSPNRLKKHVGSDAVLERLVSSGFINKTADSNGVEWLIVDSRKSASPVSLKNAKSRMVVEEILATAVLDWIRKLGLSSYDATKLRSPGNIPRVGQFGWDITGPSYVSPLRTSWNGRLVAGFFVVDVVHAELTEEQIGYFLRKCSITRSVRSMRPFIGMLVAERFSAEAFKLGRGSGVILATPENLFGAEIADGLNALIETLKNAAAVAAAQPERVHALLECLSKFEGSAGNLRGALFELIVGHLVLKGEGGSIDVDVDVTDPDGNAANIDVRRVKGDHELALYECKGYLPSKEVTRREIETWLTKKIPVMRAALMQETRFAARELSFEFWTTGRFAADAVSLLQKASSRLRKYRIAWKGGEEVLRYARSKHIKGVADTLNEHYFQHPLKQHLRTGQGVGSE